MNSPRRIGFFVRNDFQVSHFRSLFEATPNAIWIGRSAEKMPKFGIGSKERQVTCRFFLRRFLTRNFDAVITQGSLIKHQKPDKPKIVMLQYGYAKEKYNFGVWRKQAHLILAYGDYAKNRFAVSATSVSIGNPRLDDWNSPNFHVAARDRLNKYIKPDRKTVLYAPTWGDLSSLPDWIEAINALSADYNVLIKAHHNSMRDGQLNGIQLGDNVTFLPNEDLFGLMVVSDVLISDLSGAIFDGVMCKKPVVLVEPKNLETKFGDKIDQTSIELARRDEFGTFVANSDDLSTAVAASLKMGSRVSPKLYADLFHTDGNVCQNFLAVMDDLLF